MVAGLGRALASAGDVRAARETAARFAPDERGRDLFAYELAMIHLALGETEARCFERLDRALECGSGWNRLRPRASTARSDPGRSPAARPILRRGTAGAVASAPADRLRSFVRPSTAERRPVAVRGTAKGGITGQSETLPVARWFAPRPSA